MAAHATLWLRAASRHHGMVPTKGLVCCTPVAAAALGPRHLRGKPLRGATMLTAQHAAQSKDAGRLD